MDTALGQLLADKKLEEHGDMVTLPVRGELVPLRAERTVESQKRWQRAKTAARFLEIVPYVKHIGVVNTLAIDNTKPTSDIDFFIIVSPGRIWMARMMVTGILSMLSYRRHDAKIANRICLSFYVTRAAMDLAPLKLSHTEDDPHLRFWASQMVPLMDDGAFQDFQGANTWITERLPNAWSSIRTEHQLSPQNGLRSIKHAYEKFLALPPGTSIEDWARHTQLRKMASNTNSKAMLGTTEVVISENVLKFHEADRRKEYNLAYRLRLASLGIPE
jgi:predicted nucleotidyltransferase